MPSTTMPTPRNPTGPGKKHGRQQTVKHCSFHGISPLPAGTPFLAVIPRKNQKCKLKVPKIHACKGLRISGLKTGGKTGDMYIFLTVICVFAQTDVGRNREWLPHPRNNEISAETTCKSKIPCYNEANQNNERGNGVTCAIRRSVALFFCFRCFCLRARIHDKAE